VAKGLSHLVYGKFRYGNQPTTSLMEFKARNGFVQIPLPRYYVPLTAKGRICLALKLHRQVVELLPTRMLRLAVGVRAEWSRLTISRGPRASTGDQSEA
jgi:hypothetical protein